MLLLFNVFIIGIPGFVINYTQGHECGIVDGGMKGVLNGICRGSVINVMNVKQLDAMQI